MSEQQFEPKGDKSKDSVVLAPKERADVYAKLSDMAWARFSSRRDVEWKTVVGIWSAFGAATLGVLASPATFNFWHAGFTCLIVAGIMFVYIRWWLPYIAETMRRDQLVCYYWESGMQQVTGQAPRAVLEPWVCQDSQGLWRRMPALGQEISPTDVTAEAFRSAIKKIHRSQWCQAWICCLFGFLLILAVGIRAQSHHTGPKLAVDGNFEAEKSKLVRPQ